MNATKNPLAVMADAILLMQVSGYALSANDTRAARAAVAELVEAAKGMRAVTGGGNVCTVTESLAAYRRLDAALAKFGEG